MFILEIVSYIVFYVTLRWIIILLICVPAFIIKAVKFVLKKINDTIQGKTSKRATKSIMNTSEENDVYREKVRQVSKQEEKMYTVVRRIDESVDRLEKTLLGDINNEDEDNLEEDLHNLRSDEFDETIKKMTDSLNRKFATIERLLGNAGYD